MTHNIAIIGSGHIGEGLGRAWRKHNHAVTFGTRNVGDADLATLCGEIGAKAASVPEAVAAAEVVALAMPWGAVDEVLRAAGSLAGKIVIDCTNAVERGAGGMTLTYGHTTSSSEELAKKATGVKGLFKSFNAQGAENLKAPVYHGVAASNFFCGDGDAASRSVVKELVEHAGFEAVDAGPLRSARLLEPLMLLWMSCAQQLGTRDIAFKLLRR